MKCLKCDNEATHLYYNINVCRWCAAKLYNLPEEYRFNEIQLPKVYLTSLYRYIIDRCPTGGFLRAALANDLMEACKRMDRDKLYALVALTGFIHNEAPGNCHGSYEKVDAWLKQKHCKLH